MPKQSGRPSENYLANMRAELNQAWGGPAISVENVTSHEVSVLVADKSTLIKFIPRENQLAVPFYGPKLELKVSRPDKLVWQSESESGKAWTDEDVARKTIEWAWRV